MFSFSSRETVLINIEINRKEWEMEMYKIVIWKLNEMINVTREKNNSFLTLHKQSFIKKENYAFTHLFVKEAFGFKIYSL